MTKGNVSQEFRLKNTDEKKKFFCWRNRRKWINEI